MKAIYPMEGPGGYQLFGRTIPTWDTFSTREPFSETVNQPWLLNFFDEVCFWFFFDLLFFFFQFFFLIFCFGKIIFERVSEDQLLQSRDDFYCGMKEFLFSFSFF